MQDATGDGKAQRLHLTRGMAMRSSGDSLRQILTMVLASLSAEMPKTSAAPQAGNFAFAPNRFSVGAP